MKKVDFDGVTGKIAFDAKGDLRATAVTLYEARNGKFQPMSTVTGSATPAWRVSSSM